MNAQKEISHARLPNISVNIYHKSQDFEKNDIMPILIRQITNES